MKGANYVQKEEVREKRVVGRIHLESSVRYWKEIIKPAAIVVVWLENKIPLFSRSVRSLAQKKVPKQVEFTGDELKWIEKELERLLSTGA